MVGKALLKMLFGWTRGEEMMFTTQRDKGKGGRVLGGPKKQVLKRETSSSEAAPPFPLSLTLSSILIVKHWLINSIST